MLDATKTAGRVTEIWIAGHAKAPLSSKERVRAVAGRGLEGDRYFFARGSFDRAELPTPGRALTLIEDRAIEAAEAELEDELDGRKLTGGDSRRNLVVSGVDLSRLVGATFRLGGAVLEGVRLAPPCGLLDRLMGVDSRRAFKGRGGLRAEILESGEIEVGDTLEILKDGRGRLPT